jgi:Chaperone of endosialidase
MKPNTFFLVLFALLTYFVATLGAEAVVPPPDGGYPGFNTAEGDNALLNLSTGVANTAVGWFSLFSDSVGSFNTATGTGALLFNTADNNTAFGAAALLFNAAGTNNTAVGTAALLNNVGFLNTASGAFALSTNTDGVADTANGAFALFSNTGGQSNTATGNHALFSNTTANNNTANGESALASNTTGAANTAVGSTALSNSISGNGNIALGNNAGANVMTASDVTCIGAVGEDVSESCYISRIFGSTSSNGIGVFVNSDGKLGTATSSKRFKEDIKPMDKASEALFALKPVAFRYKKEIDPAGRSQFGLVAEEVEKINPELVVRDEEGRPYSVRYEAVNAMLLNEFLKEHRKVQELEANDMQQQNAIKALTAIVKDQASQIQKVSAQLAAAAASPSLADSH